MAQLIYKSTMNSAELYLDPYNMMIWDYKYSEETQPSGIAI